MEVGLADLNIGGSSKIIRCWGRLEQNQGPDLERGECMRAWQARKSKSAFYEGSMPRIWRFPGSDRSLCFEPKEGQTWFPKREEGGKGGLPLLVPVGEEFTKPDAAVDDCMEAQGKAQGEPYNPLQVYTGLRGLEDEGQQAQVPW